MLNTTAAEGVCPACQFGSDCIFEASARRPILRCEQFSLALPEPAVPSVSSTFRTAAGDNGGSRLLGLCSNCEFRTSCIYPKPEGGVWRCEEYQ